METHNTAEAVYDALVAAGRPLTMAEILSEMFEEDTPKKLLKWLEINVKSDITALIRAGRLRCVNLDHPQKYAVAR